MSKFKDAMGGLFGKKQDSPEGASEYVILSPLKGEVILLKDVPDETFAGEYMGKGTAIEPSEGSVVAPFTGTVTTLFPTGHAIGLTSEDGVEVLIHIGLDTVNLEGKGFTAHIAQGDKVKSGTLLVSFDLEAIKEAGYKTVTPVIVTNTGNFASITATANGVIDQGSPILSVEKRT